MPDLVLKNAVVYTLDNSNPAASCILIENDRILAVGGQEILALARPNARIYDMEGATVLPSFADAHIHWSWTGLNLKRIDLFDLTSKEETLARVREGLSKIPSGNWAYGFGWAQGMWPGMEFPNAADLDALTTQHPVYLKSRSGHAAWVNSLALQAAGIDKNTSDPVGGEIQRDKKGNPTGILFEEAMQLVFRHVPPATPEEIAAAVEEAQPHAWKTGLTALHDYDCTDAFDAYQRLHERGKLGLRIVKNINDPYIHHAHELKFHWGFGDNWLRLGGLKIFADGAIGAVTALMIEPYDGQPDNRGIAVMPKDRMREMVLEATRLGFPSTIHAIGDQAVRDVLDIYEEARRVEAELGIPRDQRRHRVEHYQFVHEDDHKRLAALDGIASIQPIHATNDYPMVDKYLGKRGRLGYNARHHLDLGGRVAFGSDSPVEPFDPLKGIHAAVTRRRADGSPGPEGWWPSERITIDEAVRGYTQGPAYAAGMENDLGTLAPGFLADLVVLDKDIYKIDPNDLLSVEVLGTMAGGEWKYGFSE